MTQPTPSARPGAKLPIIEWDQAYNRNRDKTVPREVLNVIRTFVNNKTLQGFVSIPTLADATGLCHRAVNKQIRANKDAGWLKVTERGNSTGAANYYLLTYPEVRELKFPIREPECTPTTPLTTSKITTTKDREFKFPATDSPLEGGLSGVGSSSDGITETSGGNLSSREPEFPDPFDDPFAPAPERPKPKREERITVPPEPADPIDLLVAALQDGPVSVYELVYALETSSWGVESLVTGSDLFVAKPPYGGDDPWDMNQENRTIELAQATIETR